MEYPATFDEYMAQKNRQTAGNTPAVSGGFSYPATFDEYMQQKGQNRQNPMQTAERERCLSASGWSQMQADMGTLFGGMDGYFQRKHRIGASGSGWKERVGAMLQNVEKERDYFNRYADVMGEDAQSYQKQLNAWEAQLKRYQKAMSGQEDDEGSLALGSGIARFQTEADAYFKKAQETTAGMSEPERANQWVSGAQTLLTEAQEIEAYLKKKNTPAAQTLMTQMAEYRKALEDMQTTAKGAQLTNPLTGKAMPDMAISGRMQLPRYTADGRVQTGYGSAYDRRLGQQEKSTLAAGMERKAEKADWQNQSVQQHEDYIRQDFEELKEYTSANTSSSQVENIHAGIFTEIAERLNYLSLSGKCTESEYEALLDKVEQWKNEYFAHAENVRKEKNNRAGNITHGELYWKDGKIVKYREAGYDKDTAAIDKIRSEAKSLLPSKGDAMKEFRYQSGSLTRENIAYTPVDELLKKMGFDHSGTDWGTSDAERRAVTFLSEKVLPEYLANTEMTQEQYDAFMQQIADAPNAAELRATREANGLNANEAGMQSALEMYRKIDAKTYADMAGTGAQNAMENVMTKYAGGMEQVLMRGLGYITKAAGKTLNLFGLAENPVGNYFVEGGQQGIDYENKDWQAGKQREYEAGRYASELTQNGSKFTQWTANMTRDLTQAALEMAAAGAIAGQISAGNTALSQLSQGGKYASSLANAQKRVSGYTKLAGQMASLMKNSSNVLISANAALNSYGEAEDAGKSMPERAVKLIAGGLIEYGTNGLFGGNPIIDPENAGRISKYITDLTDNETIRKIVSSKVFDRIGEGLEEVASAVAGAALDYALTGESDLTAKELVDEFTVGVLLSMVMSAPEDIVDLTARAKSYVQSKVITRFGKQAQSNLDVLYGTMAQYTAQYYAGDENLMRFNGWSESQIKKAKSEWNTIVREFNTLADRLESAQNISESFERYTPPQANGGFVDVEMQNIIRAEQQSNAALMTDRALDIAIITQRATIEALRSSTDAGDIFVAESAQSYLDVLDAEKSARATERAQRAAESAAQENTPTAEQTAQETPQTAQETDQSAAETIEQAEEINAPTAQETEGGMSNEQSQSVNENQERNERVGAEGQTGGVVESGSRITADRGGTGEGGGNESENLRRQKLNERVERFKGTVLDTGMDKLTADGDPDVMVGIVPVRKYTQAMKQAQREAKEQGVKTTFVVGTMSIKGEDGEFHNTDAMFDAESGRIFVSVSSVYEPEVLMEHELFHAKVHAAEVDLVTALESVYENMTAEEYTEIVEQYMKAYRGAYDSDTAVYEEILADAYAGLNRFANRSFKKLIDAMRTHAAGMQSQRESSAPTAEVSQAVRRTQDSDGNEKTAREGGTRASIDRYSYQGKSMTENSEIYSYDFLTHQPDMEITELPPLSEVKSDGKIDRDLVISLGLENAKKIGRKLDNTVVAVENKYSHREIIISKPAIQHSMDGGNPARLRTNARIGEICGEVVANAIPVNALNNKNPEAIGTYAMVALLKSGDGNIAAIITVEQHTNKVERIDTIDLAHAFNGRLVKKEGSESSTRERGYANSALPAITTFKASIADVLKIVNTTHQSILSDDVLKALGETRNPEGYYAPRVKFSASPKNEKNSSTENENLTTIRNLNEDDLEALYGSARIPVQELLTNTEGAGDVSLIVKNEDARNNNAHLENMAAVIPSSVDWWLVERLKMNGLNVVEYKAGNEQARQEAEAKAEKLLEPKKRFSLSPEEKVQRAENKLTAAQEKLEQEKEKAQERYKRDLTSGMRKLFNIQSYDSKELNGLLETPMLEMQQGVKLLKAEKDDLFEAVMNLGTETMPADDYYKEIRDTIYGQKVFVPEWVRTEFGDDWNSFKKRAMGRHKFYFVEDEGKQGIDQLYKELAEQYPGAFPDTYDMTEMLRRMEDMADKGMDTKLPYRQAMEENEKRFGLTVDEQTEHQRSVFERLLNSYAEKAGRDARIEQEKAAKAEADERLESILREADGVQPTKKAEGVVEPWTISEAAAQKRGFPYLNGRQVYPLRTWVKAADMGNYGLVLDKSTKKGMLTVLFTNKETGLSSVKDMETKLLTAVEPKYQPSVQETAALLASMPPEKLEDAADAEDLGAFYEWYDGQTEGRETNDLRPVAEERAEKSRQAAQKYEQERSESLREAGDEWLRKHSRTNALREAGLLYDSVNPMRSSQTKLEPKEALELLESATGKVWRLQTRRDGTWTAKQTARLGKQDGKASEAAQKIKAAEITIQDRMEAMKHENRPVYFEGVPIKEFKGSPAMEKMGIKIHGTIVNFQTAPQILAETEGRRNTDVRIDRYIKDKRPNDDEIFLAQQIAAGRKTMADIDESNMDYKTVKELSDLYANQRMQGENLLEKRKRAINRATLDMAMESIPTELELQANPKLFQNMPLKRMNLTAPEILIYRLFGDELGEELNQRYIYDIGENTAESIRWKTAQRDKFEKFEDSEGKRRKLTKEESQYVHIMLDTEGAEQRAKDNRRSKDILAAVQRALSGEKLEDISKEMEFSAVQEGLFYDLYIRKAAENDEKIDKTITKNAAPVYRQWYDDIYPALNELLAAYGMEPIGKVLGYTPHGRFNNKLKGFEKILSVVGLENFSKQEELHALPTEIAGQTQEFKPKKPWVSFFMKRNSFRTDYDIVAATEKYIDSVADVIFHTGDIVKLRGLESYLHAGAKRNTKASLDEIFDRIRRGDTLEKAKWLQTKGKLKEKSISEITAKEVENEFEKMIEEAVKANEFNTRYTNFAQWVTNFTNIIANKQYGGDRGMEYDGGREALNTGNKIVGLFAISRVAGNFSSVLSQCGQIATIWTKRKKRAIMTALREMCIPHKLDLFRLESSFLTNRRGVENRRKGAGEAYLDTLYGPIGAMDMFVATLAARSMYIESVLKGMSHEEAMTMSNRFGRRTMSSRAKGERATAFYGKNLVDKLMHQFSEEAYGSLDGMLFETAREYRETVKEHGKKAATLKLIGQILGYLAVAFIVNRLTDEWYGGTPVPLDIAGITANFMASGKGLPTNDYIKSLINKVTMEIGGKEIFEDVPKEGRKFDTWKAMDATLGNIIDDVPMLSNFSALIGTGDRNMPITEIITKFRDVFESWKENGVFSGDTAEAAVKAAALLVPGGNQLQKTGFGIKALIEGGKMQGYGDKKRLRYAIDTDDVGNAIRTVLFGVNATPEAKRYYAGDSYGLDADQTQLWMDLRDEGVNGYMLYGLMMRMDDAQMAIDVPKEKENETEAEEKARLQAKEARRKAARAELAAQEGLTDRQKASIYGEMVSHYNDDAIDKLLDAGMKWKDISEILDKRGELSAGAKASEWAAEFANWLDGKKYSGKNREAINEALVPQSASFYNKMTAAGVSQNNALKVEKKARALAGENDLNQTFKAQAIMQSGLSDKEAYAALGAVYTGEEDAKKFMEAQEAGIPAKVYTEYRMKLAKLKSDLDENGEEIPDSKKEKVIELIDSLNLTAEQKEFIMRQRYKNYDWWMMPWS